MNFNYSVLPCQLIPCIDDTVEEADTAPLFKIDYLNKLYMARMKQLGIVLESIQPDSSMLMHLLTGEHGKKGRNIQLVHWQ